MKSNACWQHLKMPNPTNPPNESELRQYIVDRLSGVSNREQLTMDVCQLMGWQWDRAELFIKAVEQENFRRIALGQSPLFLAFALGTLGIGLMLMGSSVFLVWSAYRQYGTSQPLNLVVSPRVPYAFTAGLIFTVGALWGIWKFAGQFIRGR